MVPKNYSFNLQTSSRDEQGKGIIRLKLAYIKLVYKNSSWTAHGSTPRADRLRVNVIFRTAHGLTPLMIRLAESTDSARRLTPTDSARRLTPTDSAESLTDSD